jgi:hypothetical protein
MRTALLAALISLSVAIPAFALDGGQPPKGPGADFEGRKTEILNRVDERLTSLQQMKACIQTARTSDDAKACRDKFGLKQGREQNFERQKAEILKNLDERLASVQQMKTCIQAAKNREDAKTCREKFGPKDGQQNRPKP